MTDYRIIRAERAHLRFCAESRYEVFRDDKDYTMRKDDFIRITENYFVDHLSDENVITLVAVTDACTIGCGTLIVQERLPHIEIYENKRGYILNVFVKPEFRGCGIAKMLMRALHEEAVRKNVAVIDLHAADKAYSLYLALGYTHNENCLEFDIRSAIDNRNV